MISRIRAAIQRDRPALPGLFAGGMFLSLPNLLTVFWPQYNHRQAETFFMGLGLILAPCIFSVTVRTVFNLWLPAAAFVPAALIYSGISGSPLREWAFVVLAETDWREIERFWSAVLTAAILAPVSLWLYWRLLRRRLPARHRLSGPSRIVILLLALIIPLGNFARNGLEFGSILTRRKIASTFPPGLVVSLWNAAEIRHQLQRRPRLAQDVPVQCAKPAPREIYLLVVGESARFRSFQVNGYERATTPLLAQTPGLLSFQDVSAPATVTLMSVPVLLTAATPANLREAPALPGLAGLFRNAGYHTAWFSTQKKHGMYDTACSIFAQDADESQFISGTFAPGAGPYSSAYDGDLLQPVRDLVAREMPRLFIVLHTMGSHQHYVDRFPPGFNRFECHGARVLGSFLSAKFTPEQVRDLTNAYDDSILYTDWVLSQLIEILASTHCVSALYYVADHGQNGGDSPILPFAHGSATPDVIQIPLLLWLSPEYRSWRPAQTKALESHLATPLAAESTFHTLLDLAGLDCPLLDRTRSAASPSFQPRRRLLRDLEGALIEYEPAQADHQTP